MLLSGQKPRFVARVIQCLGVLLLLQVSPALTHHSYAPFDKTRVLELEATIAKLEWENPHTTLWAYVIDESQESGYQLWAFETGSISMMGKAGWSRDAVTAGEVVTIEYFPLLDGGPGGELATLTHADGTSRRGGIPTLNWLRRIRENADGDAQ